MVGSSNFATSTFVVGEGLPVYRVIGPSHKIQVWKENLDTVDKQALANSNNFIDALVISGNGDTILNGNVVLNGTLDVGSIQHNSQGSINFSGSSLSNIDVGIFDSVSVSNISVSGQGSFGNIDASTGSFVSISSSNIEANYIHGNNIVYRNEPILQTIPTTKVTFQTYYKTFEWIHRGAEKDARAVQNLYVKSSLYTSCNVDYYTGNSNFGYFMKLVDMTHNTPLAEVGFSNALPSLHTIQIPSMGSSNILIELQVKKKSFGEYVIIDSIAFGY